MDKSILKKINILYVEDEEEVRTLTSNVLSKFVNSVVLACHGKEGLEIFEKHNSEGSSLDHFDLIVTDINMPKMDGLEMLEEIYKIDHNIPAIVTTAHNDADFLKHAINLRVRGYVSKPLNLHDLIDTILLAVESAFLKNKLIEANKNLESQIEEKTIELRSILDSQENMILVVDKDKLSSVNKTLLDFIGVDTIEEYKEKYPSISNMFLEGKNYFHSQDDSSWIEDISALDSIGRIVKIKNKKDEKRIFQVNIKTFFYNTTHYVVSFTDITELKQYTYELKYQATHDNLTKLYNRQKLNDDFNKEILREERYKHGLSLIMLDIDNFKQINDTYGHDVGDIVLKDISNIILKSIRKTDIASRWGGEEFMILLPETSLENSMTIAETLRLNVEKHQFVKVEGNITISLGVTVFQNGVDCKDTIVKNVDLALYEAKNGGKNKVVKYERKISN
ncbi:MAG: diguanylate cyclase [Campylobacterota bacterium]|nr:diguanylate cyclase [Campylobacterota bacterium]